MGNRKISSLLTVLFSVAAWASTPQVASVSPASGSVGTQVQITGSGFGPSAGSVTFNGATASIVSWSDTQVTATVPSSAVTGPVQVTAGGVASNANIYFTVPAPQVTSVSPTSGVVGAQITVNGSGFQATKGSNSLVLNNLYATIVSWSDTQIVATIPAGVTTGPVYAVVNSVVSNQDVLLTMPNPRITSVSPSSGPVGTQVQVNGSGFGASQGSSTLGVVNGNGMATNLNVVTWSDTQITATVPSSASTGYLRVQEGGVNSNSNVYFTIPSPQITGLSPNSGIAGTHVTISGSGFQAAQGSGSVTFNSHSAAIVSWSDTQIVATAPSATVTGPIKVTTGPNGLTSNSDVIFTFPNPLVTSVSPTSGPVGTQVQINGSGFGATQGTSTITLDTYYNPTIISWSDTQIVCNIPANTSAGQIRVTVAGISSNTNVYFNVPPPHITSVSPTSGAVGTQLTINGTGFQSTRGSGSVSFTGNSSSSIVSWIDTQIVVTVPSSATTGPVQVWANNGVASNKDVVFTMPRPYVAGVTPSSGPVGTQVTISGSGFGSTQGSSSLTFDNYAPTISSWSDTQIVAAVPVQTSAGQIKIVNGGVTSNTNVYFNIPAPQVTSISPALGVVGTQVTISGTGFQTNNGFVSFNGAAATINSWSDTHVVATVPTNATTGPLLLRGYNGINSNQDQIFSMPNPKIASAVPSSGTIGTQVTITGSGFGATQGSSTINFYPGYSATVTSWSDTQIIATVPSNASTGYLRATVGGVPSNNNVNFTVGTVTVGSLSPSAGPVGTQVTVTGSGFGSSQGTSTITFNNVAATVSSWSDTQIVATVPSSATSGPVKVTVGATSSNTDRVFSVGLVVTSISPTSGIVGTQVTINGSGFGSTRGSNYVTFNNYSGATINSWSSTQIVATVTSGCTAGPVKVVVGTSSSNQDQIFTMPNPVIATVVPSSGPVGTQVQINGSGFGTTGTGNTVSFNSVNATVTSWSDTQIVATVPATATTGLVKVTAGGVPTSNTNNVYFTVPQPHVASISPTSGAAGVQVTITGSGFTATQGSNYVQFNGLSGTISSWSDTQIVAAVQSGSSTGPVTVRVNGVSSNQDVIFTMPNPIVASLVPSSGARGSQVQINGSGFGATQGSSTIQFNTVTAIVTSWSDSQITATVPATSTTGPVKITVGGVASNNNVNFTIPAPIVSSISPSTGLVGTQVTISGTGFGATQGASYVRVNGMGPTITSWSDTQIVATIAAGTTSGPVTVNVQSVGSNQDVEFTLPNPVITRLAPSSGAIGTQVQITGSGFGATQGSNTVTFTNGVNPTVSSWSDSQITVTVPTAAVSGPVTVVNSGVTSNTNINFTVPAPQVTSITPTSGTVGMQVTVNGSGFHSTQGSGTVSLNGGSVTASSWSDTQIVFTVPAGASSGRVIVAANGVSSNQDVFFTMPNPIITGVTPSTGAMSTQVQINGSGFGARQGSSTLTFSGGPVSANVTSWSDTQIIATVPAAAISGPLQATVGGVGSPRNVYFTVPAPLITGLTPNVGGGGNPITIAGTGFHASQGSSYAAFNTGGNATVSSWSDTQIQATVPGAAGTGPVRVFVNNVPSNYMNYTVPNLVIGSLSPTGGPVGTQVTISGSGFGATQGTSTFYFNGQPATVSSWSDSQIIATVPVTATTGPTLAQVNSVNSNQTVVFTVPPPNISGFSPSGGGPGEQFTITGTGFQANQRDSTVTIHGTPVSVVSWSDTQIVATVATGTTTGPLTVTVNGISNSFETNFQVPNPVITSVTPPSAAIGGTITITGSGFLSRIYQQSQVTINGIPLTLGDTSSWSDTSIIAKLPSSQPPVTSGSLTVTVFNETSNSVPFTIEGQPNVTSLLPTTGTIGSTVTISGSGFGATQSNSTVNFNGVNAPVTSWSDSEIQVTVPANSTTGPVGVTVAGLQGQTANFELGSTTQLTDSAGNVTNYTFAMEGGTWHTAVSQGSGCSSCTVRGTTQEDYDSSGNMLDETDALGRKTTYTYDGNNNLLTQSQPLDANTNTTWTYTYNSFGEVLTATDPLNNVTTNTYDSHGNLLTVTTPKPDANTAASVTQFAYNSLGELTTITDPLNHVTTLTYTSAGLIQTITDAQNNVTTYGYDSHGNRTSVVDAMQHETDFAYEAGDRLTTITYPDHTTTGFGYDYRGRRTSVTDQNGKTTTYAYDDADRLVSVTDAAQHVTQYAYDDENNLTSITDANNHITSFQYDTFGRVKETDFPSGHAESYIYDAIGNLITKTDRNGNAITYVYDALNRLTHKGYPDSTGVDYIYDLVGKIKQATDPNGTYGFAYDNMGRLIGTSTQYAFLPGQTYTNNYTYDAASNRIGFTAPDGSTNAYAYDTLNRLSTLTNSLIGQFGFGYDALSRRTSLTRPNGVSTSYSYDSLSRLLSVLHQNGATTIDGATYTLDSAGNRTSKQNWLKGITENYSYDPIYQLTQVQQVVNGNTSTTESYTYDAVGNRLSSLNVANYTYNNSNQLTSSADGYSYTYDFNGNTLTKSNSSGATQYTWDFENRLTSVTLPNGGGVISYRYDPFGRRIQNAEPNGTTTYLYDGVNGVEEVNGGGAMMARYLQGGIDEPLARTGAGQDYYLADGLGSVTSLTDSTSNVTATFLYGAFGVLSSSTGTNTNPYRYTGRDYDSETGLYFYRARYYDASIGRFLGEDPVMFGGSDNFYRYVANAPVDLVDPFGLQARLKPVPETVPATPPGPELVPPKPPVSTIETITDWLGDLLSTSGAVGSIVLSNPLPLNQDELDWLRQRDHDRYKDVCSGAVPAGPNPCSTLSREIDRIKRCISLMIAFDARWTPGRHYDAILQAWNWLNKTKDEYNKDCTPQKPCNKKAK